MASRIKDMTKGRPAELIIRFALPLMLGSVFQQLYTMVDTIVVGRVIGVEALAAVGAADWLNWLILGFIIGFAQGFSILVAQCFGAEDYEGLRKTVAMSILLSAAIAAVTTVLSLVFLSPMLRLLNTPSDIAAGSYSYLVVLFSGITAVTAYNVFSSVLRALGDSKTPLYAMVIASAINIVLDIVFVAGFGRGIAGAAVATVIAQVFSFLYCLNAVLKIPILHMERHHWIPDRRIIGSLIKVGAPMALQNAIIGGGGLVVQYVINGFGIIMVAGFTATNKLYGLLELAATSFGFSMATFTGQNLGAGQYKRIRTGMNTAVKMAIGVALVISAASMLFGRSILLLFISGTPAEVEAVIRVAYRYLFTMSSMLFILYLLHIYRSALQGMGDTVIPMISGIIELIMRISIVLILPIFFGDKGLYFAEVTAWLGAALLLMSTYYIRLNKLLKSDTGTENPETIKSDEIKPDVIEIA